MKKFILGLLVGVTLTAAGSAYADDIVESVVGKTVQGEYFVTIDGKQLGVKAAVLDGTSYAPLRAVGEAIGRDVSFDASKGIELKEKAVKDMSYLNNKLNNSVSYKIKSDYLKRNSIEYTFQLLELDGDYYIMPSALGGDYFKFEKPFLTATLPNKEPVVIDVMREYSAGTDGFLLNGTTYIKLSFLGLTAHVEGDTLVIEKQ